MNSAGSFPAYGGHSAPPRAAEPATLRHAHLRQRLDCRFAAVDDVFDDSMDEAVPVLSTAGLEACLAHASWLGKLGRGVDPL
jgi:hypothetical protein